MFFYLFLKFEINVILKIKDVTILIYILPHIKMNKKMYKNS